MPRAKADLTSQTPLYTFGVLKSMHVGEFVREVAQELGEDPKVCKPWLVTKRQNGTCRPDTVITDQDMTIGEATKVVHRANYIWMEIAETMDKDHKPIFPSSHRSHLEILLFLKVFDVETQSLSGISYFYAQSQGLVADVIPRILKLIGWPESTPIRMFEVRLSYLC
jgi:ubiquitin carboxyl-terminal hydrolase 7